MKRESLKQILMRRDGLSDSEAETAIQQAIKMVMAGCNPEEVLMDEFGLEPDYFFDILP
jgi:hypothetical protein